MTMKKHNVKDQKIISKTIKVAEEEMVIYVALNCYDPNWGLQLTNNSNDDQFL
jgi:hypothetical protein